MNLVDPVLPSLEKIHQLADSSKARMPITLDMRKISTETDWWFICSGTSVRHLQGICDHIVKSLKTDNIKPLGLEGYAEGSWILIDYNSVIIHIFLETQREVYALEALHAKLSTANLNSIKSIN